MSSGYKNSSSITTPSVMIKDTGNHGRGVFATKEFMPGDMIETCPVVYLSPKERTHTEHTILAYYLYPWTSTRCGVMVLGYGSIYNHSFTPNAEWQQDFKAKTMNYLAIAKIGKGEEILVNYNGNDNMEPIDWFDEFSKKYR